MNPTILTTIAISAAIASLAAVARPTHKQVDRSRNRVFVTVPHRSLPDQASYGWQYFSDPRAVQAVVISPSGEYFLSQGKGLRQVTGPAGQILATRPTQS